MTLHHFYHRNRDEINSRLAHWINSLDGDLKNFKNYDENDPLCLEIANQNMLAWFGLKM